jgi:hypothetical protein
MAISGSQLAYTPARSNLARSGASRSGWPIAVGVKVPLYALSNIARSNATRSAYVGPAGFVSIGGVPIGTNPATPGAKIVGDLTITDVLNQTPNRCTFRVRGLIPAIGQDVRITVGSKNTNDPLFAGQVLNTTHVYVGSPANYAFEVNAIDWTWGLNQRLITKRWQSVSATVIGQDIVAIGAPGYSAAYVQPNLPVLNEFTVTDQDVPATLTALAKRVGGYWYVDYNKTVHLFAGDDPYPGTPPTILNAIHPTLTDLTIDRDGSQLVTRVYVEGGGSVAASELPPGETKIPLVTASWYPAAGGVVKSGPQRITYTAATLGGGGTLVGPGASPSAVLNGVVIGGSGVTTGTHDYAVSFVTATGESLTGPRLTLTTGVISPPATAATITGTQAGVGPDVGGHWWAVTFVTATGETTVGPPVIGTVPEGPVPIGSPTPGTPTTGGNLGPGSYQYAVTYLTASGESTPGPVSAWATMVPTPLGPPTSAPSAADYQTISPPGLADGTYRYAVTFLTASNGGQTLAGPASAPLTLTGLDGLPGNTGHTVRVTNIPTGGSTVTGRRVYRTKAGGSTFFVVGDVSDNVTTSFTDTLADSALGGTSPSSSTGAGPLTTAVPLSNIPRGSTGVTKRRIYRGPSNTGPASLRLLVELANNTTTTYTDTTATGSLGGAPPTINTAGASQVVLDNLPIGGADVTARRVYRTPANSSSPYGLVATVADNATRSLVDSVPDASLGGPPPVTATALANRVQLSAIPVGAAAVTQRKVYRTPAGSAALQLLTTLADNATTVYLDALADAALGAAPAGSDTSGLTQPAGNVPAGSTSIIVAGAAAFDPAGGWAVIGNGQQVIRYTGRTANSLIGVPASGSGAIVASVAYNSTITASPMLVGVPPTARARSSIRSRRATTSTCGSRWMTPRRRRWWRRCSRPPAVGRIPASSRTSCRTGACRRRKRARAARRISPNGATSRSACATAVAI